MQGNYNSAPIGTQATTPLANALVTAAPTAAPPATAPPTVETLTTGLADLRAQSEATQAALAQVMANNLVGLVEQMAATNAATAQALANVQASITNMQAAQVRLQATVDSQRTPFNLLTATMVKVAGVTLVSAAVATTVTLVRNHRRNGVAGAM
jgi:hypothetical protein